MRATAERFRFDVICLPAPACEYQRRQTLSLEHVDSSVGQSTTLEHGTLQRFRLVSHTPSFKPASPQSASAVQACEPNWLMPAQVVRRSMQTSTATPSMLVRLAGCAYGTPGQLPAGFTLKQEKPRFVPPVAGGGGKVSWTQRLPAAQWSSETQSWQVVALPTSNGEQTFCWLMQAFVPHAA